MKKKKIVLLFIALFFAVVSMAQKNVYKFEVKDGAGNPVKLKEYKGKVLLIVNTAFTVSSKHGRCKKRMPLFSPK